MTSILKKSFGYALASLLLSPAYAQESSVNLISIYNMRIGATCDELADSFNRLADKALFASPTRCLAGTSFSKDELWIESDGKDEIVELNYTPEGRLWSVKSHANFKGRLGPAADVTVRSLFKRFGVPSVYADDSQDTVVRKRLRENGHKQSIWRAAWSSKRAPWVGSVNTHMSLTRCESVLNEQAKFRCELDRINQSTESWESRLAALGGVVTTVLMSTNIADDRLVLSLRTQMYDPKFVVADTADRKRRIAIEKDKSDARDIEKLPKF